MALQPDSLDVAEQTADVSSKIDNLTLLIAGVIIIGLVVITRLILRQKKNS